MESGSWRRFGALCVAVVALGCSKAGPEPKAAGASETVAATVPTSSPLLAEAEGLAQRFIIVDGHVDLPFRLKLGVVDGRLGEDVSARTPLGDFDFPRARQGGLDAPFMWAARGRSPTS